MSTNPFNKGLKRYLTSSQLKLIRSVHIGIGGAGGLGSNIAMILARTGFYRFEILDSDKIEPSNLNRQQYFLKDINKFKVDVLRNTLTKINPDIRCRVHRKKWNKKNAKNYFKECNVIIEAFDQAEDKKSFVEFYQDKAPLIISGIGMAGLSNDAPVQIKQIGKNIFIVGKSYFDTKKENPPLAPRVTLCAAMMANVILNQVLKIS